jgi:YD repeat-containing protein
MLDGAGLFPGNDCPPDLDLLAVGVRTIPFGQPLSFNLFSAGATVVDLDAAGNPTGDTIRIVVDPDIGTDTPVGVTLSETGDFTWTPTESQVGLHRITVIAIDGGSPALADAETFQVRVLGNNQSPNLSAIADQQATVGEEIVVNVTASDPNTGDTLTFFLDPNDAPASATIEQTSNTTAIIRWTPGAGDLPGPVSFTVLVSDDGNLPLVDSESFSVTLTPSNEAPDLATIAAQTATVGTQMVVHVTATDPDAGDTLTFALDKDNGATPADAILQQTSNTTATIRWTPDLADVGGPIPFRVLVTDNGDPAEGDSEDFQVTVSAAAGAMVLAEESNFRTAMTQAVALGQSEGTRTLAFNLETAFDETDSSPAVEDLFQVFLVDANDPAQTLLDNGKPGTAVFTLAGGKAEFQPGQVRYDGSRVEIDVTGLGALTTANVVFQLLNSDSDEGTKVALGPITNTTNTEALAAPRLALSSSPILPGGAIDLGTLSVTSQVAVTLQNVRFDPSTGNYAAELIATNTGPAIGRQLAVRFAGLPIDVVFENASGVDGSGDPYVNLTSAIGSGGLAAGASSRPVTIRLSNPNGSRFRLVPAVLSGGPNAAPILGEIAPITAVPGDYVEVQLGGQDADGDKLTYSLSSPSPLPGGALMADGRLIFKPAPGQEGVYEFTVTLSDGVESVTRSSSIVVETDPSTTTRIEGVVLGTNGVALEGVPIDIGGFTTLTGPDGAFTIELPTLTAPSESFNITVPTGDPHLDPFSTGQAEIPFRRAVYDPTTGTSADNPRQHPNLVSSFIDASMVYGSDDERASALRTFSDGKLKVSSGDLLPLNDAATFPDGLLQNDNEGREDPTTLFASGDTRTNENIALIALHTVLVREHNRLASDLKAGDPSLTDEEIYQQARRLVGAMIQQITYYEYLPLLLGPDAIAAYSGYRSDVNPTQSELFAAAAFRVGHSQLNAEFHRLDASGQPLGSVLSLQDVFFTTEPVKSDGIEPYLRGLAETLMQEIDVKIIDGVRNFLFGPPGAGGMDLAAMNLQRGRDVGLPSYTQARLDFGLSPVTSFDQITSDLATRQALQSIYGTVDKVDIWIGGLAEDHAAGAMVGPLFQAIIADQFQRGRDGDRFWYENGQLTGAEMTIVRNTTLESLIERNAPGVDLSATPFTTGTLPTAPVPAGSTATSQIDEYRSIDGAGNNLAELQLGASGGDRLRNFTNGYGDGVSTPAGADRPGAREVSNAVSAQSGSLPNASGATALMTFWGQLIDHDMGLGPAAVSDTLRIQGDLKADDGSGTVYPFVAEKLPLVLGHDVYPGAKNVIGRPIYLPVLDVAGGTMVDPASDTMVEQEIAPGLMASVFVEAGTLKMDNGGGTMVDFSGILSITRVPTALTPAALPPNLRPDLVVTIQPSEMVFTQPAPINFPNSANYAPGTTLNLWSINPVTGQFDDVGDMVVSADGSVIETVSGGIRSSSWHFPAPEPEMMNDNDDGDEDNDCDECKATGEGPSEIELHSGNYLENHALVTYQSLGQTRGFGLHYDSLRANPKPIVFFGFGNVNSGSDRRIVATLEVERGNFMYQVPGYTGSDYGLLGGEHIWTVPSTAGPVRGSLQIDMSDAPTGVYNYNLTTGILNFDGTTFAGSTSTATKQLRHVNYSDSPFGAGWGLIGLERIHENPDGSLLLVDGDGSELYFGAATSQGSPYDSPPGDFSDLVKLGDGTFQRTMTDQSVYRYGVDGRITSMTDRNGNETTFAYDANGVIERITDPVGLQTVFASQNGRVTSITDPANRVTALEYDSDGNLTKVTDPDGTFRTWDYDGDHHIVQEIDKLGRTETTDYNFAGRVEHTVLSDGTETFYSPVQTQYLKQPSATTDPLNPPEIDRLVPISATYSDSNGNVTEVMLDKQGQATNARDGQGPLGSLARNADNQVQNSFDSRGFSTNFTYDAQGNVLSITDQVGALTGGSLFVTGHDSDDHSNGDYQRAGLDYLTFGQSASTPDEVATRSQVKVGFLGNTDGANRGAAASGYTNRTFIDLDNPNWAETAFDGTFEILVIGTGGDFVNTAGSNSLNAEATRFADYFNEGGGIYVNTDQGSLGQAFYNFLPTFGATQAAVGGTGVYSVTPEGALIGLTEAIVDSDPTHTEYQNVDTTIFRVFETHNQTGDAVAIGLFGGFIGGGFGGVARQFFTYDPNFSQPTSYTDGQGNRYLYEVDATTGNRRSSTRVVGQIDVATNGETDDLTSTMTYTAEGLVDTMIDPLGRVTDYDYDARGLLGTVTYAKGTADEAVMRFEYDLAGNQTAMIDGNSNRTEYQYDVLNRLVRTIEADPDGGGGPLTSPTTQIAYDARGNVASATDARGNTTTSLYDDKNRLIESTGPDPDGAGPLAAPVTRYAYDLAGNLASLTDANGNVTQYQYDSRNRRVAMTDPDGGVTRFAYDADDNLARVTDPVGNVTRFVYDARSRLVEETDPLGKKITYAYDAADNLIQKVDRNGRETRYAYDDLNRLVKEEWIGAADVILNTIEYAYDAVSNLTSVFDAYSSLEYTYDARNRVQTVDNRGSEATRGTPSVPRVILTYAYDDNSNVLSVTDKISAAAGATTGYAYDALDRLVRLTQNGANTSDKRVDFAYNPLGQYASIDRFSDLAGTQLVIGTDYTYDSQNRLTRLDHQNSAGASVAFYDYVYDLASRITQITDIDGVTDYTYDDRDQLTGADRAVTDIRGDESYEYDANGNRVGSSLHGSGYVTGPANRLLSDGTYDYEYDAEGNMTLRTEIATGDYRVFVWDHRNRLVGVNDFLSDGTPVQEVEFAYDALNRRISKAVDDTPLDAIDAVFETFVYDREDIALVFSDPDGQGPQSFDLSERHLHADGIDESYAQEGSGNTLWLLHDHLGSTRILTDDSATALNRLSYDSYGNVESKRPAVTTAVHRTRIRYRNRPLPLLDSLLRTNCGAVHL